MENFPKKKIVNGYLKILIAIIICVVSIVMLVKSTNIVENVLVSYNTDSSVDYKVYIFK